MEASSESAPPWRVGQGSVSAGSGAGHGVWSRSRSRSIEPLPGQCFAPKRKGKIPKNRPGPTSTPARPAKAKPSEAIPSKAVPSLKKVAKAIMDEARAIHDASGSTPSGNAESSSGDNPRATATPGASSGQLGATANEDAAPTGGGSSSGQQGNLKASRPRVLGPRPRPQNFLSPAEWAACPWRLGQAGPYDWEY